MYLARNSNGCLFLHEQKPTRVQLAGKGWWHSTGAKMPYEMKNVLTWKDEPLPVRLEADWINESRKFNAKVDKETVNRLNHLIPNKL